MDTSTLTVSLPEPLKAFVDGQVARGRFRSASQYIGSLLREAQRREARGQVEALLRDGLESGFTQMTAQDWKRLKESVKKRRAPHKKQ